MANHKTEFELEFLPRTVANKNMAGRISISFHGSIPVEHRAATIWIKIDKPNLIAVIPENDAERFAVNILKALKSKHLKP